MNTILSNCLPPAKTRLGLDLGALLLAVVVTGCGGGGSAATSIATAPLPAATSAPPIVASPSAPSWGGHFVGSVRIADAYYFADALLTVDGSVRLYIGGPVAASGMPGTLQSKTARYSQFVGNVEVRGNEANGVGAMVANGCSPPYILLGECGDNVLGNVHIIVQSGDNRLLQGEIVLNANSRTLKQNGATHTLFLDMRDWNGGFAVPTFSQTPQGLYQEELAEFAVGTDTTISVDRDGKMFFESAASGCIGNGIIAPRADWRLSVYVLIYEVTLRIDNCQGPYERLNGSFAGLATWSIMELWDSDLVLRFWLTEQGWPNSKVPLMLSARPL